MRAIPEPKTYSTHDIADYVNTHFDEDKEKLEAVYIWVTYNIDYNMGKHPSYMDADKLDAYIEQTLRKRKGICQAYAEVFHSICQNLNILSYVVSGFVKAKEGEPLVPHAWVAAYQSQSWQLIDPTFGAGYVSTGEYFKEYDPHFFYTHPDSLIKSHYPVDPIWQLKYYPETMQEFLTRDEGADSTKVYFNFPDSINMYLLLDEPGRLHVKRQRIIDYSSGYQILKPYVDVLDQQIAYYATSKNIEIYNQCIENYNLAVAMYNDKLLNNEPSALSANKKKSMQSTIESLQELLMETQTILEGVDSNDVDFNLNIITMRQAINALLKNVGEKERALNFYSEIK